MKLYKITQFIIFVRSGWGEVGWCKVLNVRRKGGYQNRTSANKEGGGFFGHFVIT